MSQFSLRRERSNSLPEIDFREVHTIWNISQPEEKCFRYFRKETIVRVHRVDQSGVKPWINGRYDLREVEPLDHSMTRTYRDRRIRIFTNAY